MLSEAPPDSVIWIDKGRRRAVRGPKATTLAEVSAALGTQFNLRQAKALRARVVLFVEGKDMKIVRSLARTLGARHVSTETHIAVIPLEGFDNWEHLEPFAWLFDALLHRSVPVFVVLDRDYRPATAVKDVLKRLAAIEIRGHVWERKELESYLLEPAAIARLSGATVEFVRDSLTEIAATKQHFVLARMLAEENKLAAARGKPVPTTERVSRELERNWRDLTWRLHHCPPKEMLSELNGVLDGAGNTPISTRRLAAELRVDEIAGEVADLIAAVEAPFA
jgi:predicted ATP-dependent endonuclease of OLD family